MNLYAINLIKDKNYDLFLNDEFTGNNDNIQTLDLFNIKYFLLWNNYKSEEQNIHIVRNILYINFFKDEINLFLKQKDKTSCTVQLFIENREKAIKTQSIEKQIYPLYKILSRIALLKMPSQSRFIKKDNK